MANNQAPRPRKRGRYLVLGGLVVIVAIGAAVVLMGKSPEGYLADARTSMQKGDYRGAIVNLKKVARSNPDNLAARFELGMASLAVADAATAERELKLARSRNYEDKRLTAALGQAYLMQAKYKDLLNEIDPKAGSPEEQADALTARGFAHMGLNQMELAEGAFKLASETAPNAARAHIGLAWIQLAKRENATAAASIDKAVSYAQDNDVKADALALKAQIQRSDRDNDGALVSLNAAVAANPESVQARIGRATLLLNMNKLDEAEADVKAIQARFPRHQPSAYLQASIHLLRKDEKAAFDLLQRQGEAINSYAPSLFLMARLQLARRQPEAAQSSLVRYLDLAPTDVPARLLLGSVLIRRNFPEQAIAVLKPAAESSEDVRVFRLLANAAMRSNRTAEAQEWLDRAAAVAPDARARTEVAFDRLGAGQVDAAVKDLDAALALDPNANEAKILRLLTMIRQNKTDDAARDVAALRKDLPDSPIPDNIAGAVALARGDMKGALDAFNAALARKPDFVPALMNAARVHAVQGRLDEAAKSYEAVLATTPGHLQAMMSLAEIAAVKRDNDGMVAWLNKAKTANPDQVRPRQTLVNYYLDQRRLDLALNEARDFVAKLPGNPAAMDSLARAQFANNDREGAVASYRAAIAAVPQNIRFYESLVQVQVASKDMEGAKSTLRNGISANPDAPQLVGLLAAVQQRDGQSVEALRTLRDWAARHPRNPAGSSMVGDYLSQQGRYAEAAEAYALAFRDAPSTTTVVPLAMARSSANQNDAGIAVLNEWLKNNPKDNAARFALTSVQIKAGKFDEAIRDSETLLQEGRDNPVLLNNLAWLHGQKNLAKGIEYGEEAFKLAPKAPEVADTLGFLLVRKGDIARGHQLLEQAYTDSQQNPEIGYHYAVALKQLGKNAQAREVLEKATTGGGAFAGRDEAMALLQTLSK